MARQEPGFPSLLALLAVLSVAGPIAAVTRLSLLTSDGHAAMLACTRSLGHYAPPPPPNFRAEVGANRHVPQAQHVDPGQTVAFSLAGLGPRVSALWGEGGMWVSEVRGSLLAKAP